MNISRMQRQQVALKVGVAVLHREHMPAYLFDHIRNKRLLVGEQITVAWLIKPLGQKIYLKTTG